MLDPTPTAMAYGLIVHTMWVVGALLALRILSDMFERWRRTLHTDERLELLELANANAAAELSGLDKLQSRLTTLEILHGNTRDATDNLGPKVEAVHGQVQQHGRKLQEVVEMRSTLAELSKTVADARTRLGRMELGEGLTQERAWR